MSMKSQKKIAPFQSESKRLLENHISFEEQFRGPGYYNPDFSLLEKERKARNKSFTTGRRFGPDSYLNYEGLKLPGPGQYDVNEEYNRPDWGGHNRSYNLMFNK